MFGVISPRIRGAAGRAFRREEICVDRLSLCLSGVDRFAPRRTFCATAKNADGDGMRSNNICVKIVKCRFNFHCLWKELKTRQLHVMIWCNKFCLMDKLQTLLTNVPVSTSLLKYQCTLLAGPHGNCAHRSQLSIFIGLFTCKMKFWLIWWWFWLWVCSTVSLVLFFFFFLPNWRKQQWKYTDCLL